MIRMHSRRLLRGAAPLVATGLLAAGFAANGMAAGAMTHIELLASACSGCHGDTGEGYGALPAIAGQPSDVLLRSLQEFQSGQRRATVMHRITQGFTSDELAALARYFATLDGP